MYLRLALLPLVAVAAITAIHDPAQPQHSSDAPADFRKEVDTLRDQVATLTNRMNDLETEIKGRKSEHPQHVSDSNADLRKDVDTLRDQVATLTNRLGHLETEVKAGKSEGEFKQLTIDSVRVSDEAEQPNASFLGHKRGTDLLCHVVEWSGYPRMLRFTRTSDHEFYLDAPGHARLEARMTEGGICNDSGSTRLVMLSLKDQSQHLDPGVEYAVHPRNDSAEYKWIVPASVVVKAK
jgi:uncharacterized coiled-coil protein SlyX